MLLHVSIFNNSADGCILLHAPHAARNGYQAIVLCVEDTDVLIMALAVCNDVATPIYQRSSTRTRLQLWDIQNMAASVGPDVCKAIIGSCCERWT